MTRPAAIAGVLVSALGSLAAGQTGVRVDGVFVRTGTFTPITEVQVGQPVQLIVRVQDTSTSPQGVAGGYVDVTWSTGVLQLLDQIDGDGTDDSDVEPLFGSVWTAFYAGEKIGEGLLTGMGSGQGFPPVYFEGDVQDFFTLNFNPIAKGSAGVTLTGHDFGVIVLGDPNGASAPATSVDPTLTVVDAPGPGPGPGPGPTPPCLGSALAVGAVGLGGLARLVSGRRREGR